MQRLLVTVAFSALVLGVASTGLHAQTSGTTAPTPSMSSGKTGTTTQSNSSMSSSQSGASKSSTQNSTMSSSDTKSTAPAKTAQKTTTTKSSAKKTSMSSSQDHVADDLNRQSLNQMGGAQTSYGSSGSTMAPSSTTTGSAPAKR